MAITSVTSTIAGQLSSSRHVLTYASGDSSHQVVIASGATLDQIVIDNTAGTAQIFVRIWDSNSVSVGTTKADFIFTAGAGEKNEISFLPGPVFDTALTAQVSQSKGYGSGPTAVAWAASVTFLTH